MNKLQHLFVCIAFFVVGLSNFQVQAQDDEFDAVIEEDTKSKNKGGVGSFGRRSFSNRQLY